MMIKETAFPNEHYSNANSHPHRARSILAGSVQAVETHECQSVRMKGADGSSAQAGK